MNSVQDSEERSPPAPLDGAPHGQLAKLRRRIYLTYQYHGAWSVLVRAMTFPLRFTPLRRYIPFGSRAKVDLSAANGWYRKNWRPVTIVIPSFRDADNVAALVKSIRRTTRRSRVQIVVADDASGAEHIAALKRIKRIQIVEGDENAGFAANVNRGIRGSPAAR